MRAMRSRSRASPSFIRPWRPRAWNGSRSEAVGIARVDAGDAIAVARLHFVHQALAGAGLERILIARAHVRHVHSQNPETPVAFALAHFRQRIEKALHSLVVFGFAAFHQAPGEAAAKNRQNARLGA